MTPERWRKIEGIFHAAATRPVEEQSDFLDEACAGDESLRRKLDKLLARDRASNGSFDKIASEAAASWMLESERHELIGQSFGRYEILALLGSGGMGQVYLARDKSLDRKVALKLLPRHFTQDRDRLRRFEQEARAASALNHPNIITIYEIGEWNGAHFIATEFIEGETLRAYMKKAPQLSELLEIGQQIAGALATAHAAGIIHRDIKPTNIMVRHDGYIKVLDFGLAKLSARSAPSDLTAPDRVMGTIDYMSPEQALRQQVDHRTDIFSLGAVLYEMATDHRPFEGESEAAVYDSILNKTPRPLADFDAQLPVELDQIIRRALEKDPDQRYQSASDLRVDLKLLAQGSGSTEAALAASRPQRNARWLLYWRSAALAAFVLATAAALWLWQWSNKSLKPGQKSIAVLPFQNLSQDPDNAYFVEGIQDEILTNLAKVADLKVISRTSVIGYRETAGRNLRKIGHELGVAHLLQGSVQRAGDRVRVNTQLIDAWSEAHLWAQTYDRALADVFGIQSEIAKAIAEQLQARLSPQEKAALQQVPTANLAAFELYTRAKALLLSFSFSTLVRNNLLQAVDLLNQAVALDPNFLLAYCQLARAHDRLYFLTVDHTAGRLAAAETAVMTALRLGPESGEAHLALAEHRYRGYLDYDGARRELAFAQRALPNEPVAFELAGYIDRRQGRWNESTRNLERAIELDPHNIFTLQQISLTYSVLGRYDKMAAALDRALAINPKDVETRIARGQLHLLQRADPRPLRAEIDGIVAENPDAAPTTAGIWLDLALCERDFAAANRALAALSTNTYGPDAMAFTPAFARGFIARVRGDNAAAEIAFKTARAEQEQVVREQPDHGPAICLLGLIDAALGRKEDALREGRRAMDVLPASRDAIGGADMMMFFAIICAWTGEKDLALSQLKTIQLKTLYVTFGKLKLHPFWDPLRGDPRFEQIVASLAPR